MANQGSSRLEKATVIRGHHVYKDIWTPYVGEELSLSPEDDNDHDRYAVAVVKGRNIVGHIPHIVLLQLSTRSHACSYVWQLLNYSANVQRVRCAHLRPWRLFGTRRLFLIEQRNPRRLNGSRRLFRSGA